MSFWQWLRSLLEALIVFFSREPVRARIVLSSTSSGATAKAEAMNPQIPVLFTDLATLALFDKANNPTVISDPTTVSVVWSTSDTTVLGVTPNSTNPLLATVASTGKVGLGIVITAVITSLNSLFQPLTATLAVDVPAGVPASAQISLASPVPPPAPAAA